MGRGVRAKQLCARCVLEHAFREYLLGRLDLLEPAEKVLRPALHRVARDAVDHRVDARPLLVFGHRQRRVQCRDHRIPVERIDLHGVDQFAGGSGHLGEHEHTVSARVSGDILLGDEVHAVTQGGDERDIGDRVHARERVERQAPVEVADGSPIDGGVRAVDPAYEFVDLALEQLVVLDSRA